MGGGAVGSTIAQGRVRLMGELQHSMLRECGFDGIMKMRTSRGIDVAKYIGNFRKGGAFVRRGLGSSCVACCLLPLLCCHSSSNPVLCLALHRPKCGLLAWMRTSRLASC